MTAKKIKHIESQPVFITTDAGAVIPFDFMDAYAVKSGPNGEVSQRLPKDRFGSEYTMMGLIPPLYDLETLIGLLEMNVWHFRCCKAKADDTITDFDFIAAAGFKEMVPEQKSTIEAFFTQSKVHGRPVKDIFRDALMDFQSMGHLAIEVVRVDYNPKGVPALLASVPGHTIRPHKDGNKFCQKRGTKTRWFKRFGYEFDVDKESGDESPINSLPPDKRATEIIWQTDYSGRSDFYGMAQIIPAIGAVEGSVALRDYNISFFRNYGIPSYAIYITGDYALGQMLRTKKEDDGTGTLGEVYNPSSEGMTITNFEYAIIASVKKHLANIARNPHAPLIMAIPGTQPESKVEVKFVPLSVDVKEASFRLYKKDNRDEILTAHGVPGYRVGLTETGSLGGNTASESSRIYRDTIIRPLQESLASLLNIFIIQDGFGFNSVELYFEDFGIDEDEHNLKVAESLVKNAAMTPGELRTAFGSRFGLEASDDPALKRFYMNGNPITTDATSPQNPPATEQAGAEGADAFVEAVKSFQGQLLDIVTKEFNEEDHPRDADGKFTYGGGGGGGGDTSAGYNPDGSIKDQSSEMSHLDPKGKLSGMDRNAVTLTGEQFKGQTISIAPVSRPDRVRDRLGHAVSIIATSRDISSRDYTGLGRVSKDFTDTYNIKVGSSGNARIADAASRLMR